MANMYIGAAFATPLVNVANPRMKDLLGSVMGAGSMIAQTTGCPGETVR